MSVIVLISNAIPYFTIVILSLSLTGLVTQFTKITVGRPRPGEVFEPTLTSFTIDRCY